MASFDQSETIARLSREGWVRAPSSRPLIEHRPGEPVMMTRGDDFVIVPPSGDERPATSREIETW